LKLYYFLELSSKLECCDLRICNHVIQDLHDDRIGNFFTRCRYASKRCPGKCWPHADHAYNVFVSKNARALDKECERFGLNPSGHPLVGYVKVSSNCGTSHKVYHKKLCCKQDTFVLPNGREITVDYAEIC